MIILCHICVYAVLQVIVYNSFICAEETTYIVALLGQSDRKHASEVNVTYKIVITNPEKSDINVNVTGKSGLINEFKVKARGFYSLELHKSYGLYQSHHRNKSLILYSNSSFTLQTFIFNHDTGYSEGFLGIPIHDLLGPYFPRNYYEYIVATFCGMSGYCQFAIAALENRTVVSVNVPQTVESITFCIHGQKFDTSRNTYLTLNRYYAVQFESTMDLSETRIFSKQPIVVFVGARNVTHNGVTSHIVEQLQPSSQYGTVHLVRNANSAGDSIIKIAANWGNTTVNVPGYKRFKIPESSHVITRQLLQNQTIVIHSSRPIQVIQISGLNVNSTVSKFSPSMVIQPPMLLWQPQVTGYCNGYADFLLHLEDNDTINLSNSTEETFKEQGLKMVKYSTRLSGVFSFKTTNSGPIGGVMKCGETATMALNFRRRPSKQTAADTGKKNKPSVCDEGLEAYITHEFDPHRVDISEYSRIRVWMKMSGQVMFQFSQLPSTANSSIPRDNIIFEISQSKIMVTRCKIKCRMTSLYKKQNRGNKNNIAAITFSISDYQICSGVGPFYNTSRKVCSNSTVKPNQLAMMSTHGEAYILYDLENKNCTKWLSDWRCEDRIEHCNKYEFKYCNKSEFEDFSMKLCPKYCNTCKPDSRGRKFYLSLPVTSDLKMIQECSVYVMTSTPNAFVYVGYDDEVIPAFPINDNYTRYDCISYYNKHTNSSLGTVMVISNVDVVVNVFIFTRVGKPVMFSVYPVDTLSRDYVPFTRFGKYSRCYIVSPEENVVSVRYFDHTNTNKTSTKTFSVKPKVAYVLGSPSGFVGRRIKSRFPVGIFCGTEISYKSHDQSFYQLYPFEAVGTNYITPSLGFLGIPINITLVVSPAFEEAFIEVWNVSTPYYQYITEKFIYAFSSPSNYRISSDNPISVGLLYRDKKGTSQFIQIPASENYDAGSLLAFPVSILRSSPYNVSEITTYFRCEDGMHLPENLHDNSSLDVYTVSLPKIPCMTASLLTGNNRWYLLPGHWTISDKRKKKIIEDVCVTSSPIVGDNVDNDCDGVVDEEICHVGYGRYGNDSDKDGAYNEDCAISSNASSIVKKPRVPVCIRKQTEDKDHCWVPCKCPCSWKRNLEKFNRLTGAERGEFIKESDKKYSELLQVEKELLSKRRNSKLSIPDNRISSKCIGYSGISLFLCLLATIIILDMKSIINAFFIFWENLKVLCKCTNVKRQQSQVGDQLVIELKRRESKA